MKTSETQVVKRASTQLVSSCSQSAPSPKSQSKQIIQEHSIFSLFLQQETKKENAGII